MAKTPKPLGTDESGEQRERTREEFEELVLQGQIALVRSWGRTGFADIPEAELELVEHGYKLRKVAAAACRQLLTDARAALAGAQAEQDRSAKQTRSIGITSAYRSVAYDTQKWRETFALHYGKTKDTRAAMPGGPHGDAAVQWLVGHMKGKKAPPGYSNHSNGMAVDFKTQVGRTLYTAFTSQNNAWKTTWLHQWLRSNAGSYGFKPLATESFHWDYR